MVYYGVNFTFCFTEYKSRPLLLHRIDKLTVLHTRTNIHSEWHLYYMLCFNTLRTGDADLRF